MPIPLCKSSLVLLVLLFVPVIPAQSSSGTISGNIADQNNAGIAGANVIATNVSMSVKPRAVPCCTEDGVMPIYR